MSDANKKILTRFQNSWFLKRFGDTVRDPTECNLVVVSQQLKVCIARFECISSSLSNCFDLLIPTVVLLEFKYKCTEWSNDELWCQRRIISRWVSSPRSVTGQVFATVSAMDTISTSASSSECIMLISKAGNWIPAFKKCLFVMFMQENVCFLHSQGIMEGSYNFSSKPSFTSSDMFTAFWTRNQVASIKYDCYVFNCPVVVQQIVLEGLIYFIKRARNSPGSLCNNDPPPPPLIKNIMGILKDIRHIHLESPSWSNRALNPKHSRNTCLLCLWRRKSPFFTVNGVWRDGTTFLSSLPLLRLICLLSFGQGNR